MREKQKMKLADALIRHLAEHPWLSARELHTRLKGTVTLQAVYKEISTLQVRGAVVKAHGKFALHLSWILETINWAERTYQRYLQPGAAIVLPEPNKKLRWSFGDLLRFDDFWSHLLSVLLRESAEQELFEWIAHPWYELVHDQKEQRFRRDLTRLNKRLFLVIGQDTKLARQLATRWSTKLYEVSFATAELGLSDLEIVNVVGDYLVLIRIPPQLAQKINTLFLRQSGVSSSEEQRLVETLKLRATIRLELKHDSARAETLKRKFKRHFGVVSLRGTRDD